MNEQKARHNWADYAMQLRISAVINARVKDSESSIVRLATKNRRKALEDFTAS